MARTPPPLGGVAFALALTYCARAGPLLAPISCLARAITPRAPSADRLRGAIGATQNTLQSLSCRGQYGCSVVKGVPPAPDCPCIALASCLARAAHGLTDPHVHAQTTSEFLRQPELSAPVGGRALGRRSEGSLLAAELLRAGLEPGVQPLCRLDGLMPVQPCPRCAPARPPRMRRGARARTRAARPRAPWAILSPLVSQPTTPVCPDSCRSRRELLNEVLYACWVRDFGLKNRLKGKNFLPGLRPGPRIEHPSLDAPPRRSGGLVASPRLRWKIQNLGVFSVAFSVV